MSRPNSSVPSQKYSLGGTSRQAACCSSGGYGASSGAPTAATTATSTIAAPRAPMRLRRNSLSRPGQRGSGITDARIDSGVEDIHHQVDQTAHQRDQQHPALHNGVIARIDGIQEKTTQPRHGEDLLDDYGAAEKIPKLHAHDGQDRY